MGQFKQTDIGLIPEDWDLIKLGDENRRPILELKNGLTDPQTENESNYRVTRIETISNECIDLERTKYIENITDEKVDKFRIRKGDILFSHINSDPHIGKSAIAKRDYYDLLHGLNLLLFRTNDEVLHPEFLNYIFNYYRSIGIFIKICSRAVNQSSINQGKLKSLFIPLPPLPEQKKIAHILSKIQQAIDTQEQIIKTTQELKKALMQKLFTEGLNSEPQKQTKIGLIPESWEVVEFENSIIKNNFSRNNLINASEIKEVGSFPVIDQGQDFIAGYSDYSSKVYTPTNPAIIFGDHTRIFKYVDFPFIGGADGIKIFFPDTDLFYSKFYFYSLLNLDIPSRGYNRHYKLLKEKKIPKPAMTEQKEIAKTFSLIDSKIEHHTNYKNQLLDLFKSMLSQLMTGQIRVKDIEFDIDEEKVN